MAAMRVLVFGGTYFVGKAIVESLLAAGHSVTIHNRGVSRPTAAELFPSAHHIQGDRFGTLSELAGQSWDVAIDVNGYLPLSVFTSSAALADSVGRLCFISTVSVLDGARGSSASLLAEDGAKTGFSADELEALGCDPWEATDRQGDIYYGPMKALCEEAAERAMPGRVLTIRPGIVAGPDCGPSYALWSCFLTWWPHRLSRRDGTAVLAPPRETVWQLIDVQDLSAFVLQLVEDGGAVGVYNTVNTYTVGEVLDACADAAAGASPPVHHASSDWLRAEGLGMEELPLWELPGENTFVDHSKATAAGLGRRSAAEMVAGARNYTPAEGEMTWGLEAAREAELVRRWTQSAL